MLAAADFQAMGSNPTDCAGVLIQSLSGHVNVTTFLLSSKGSNVRSCLYEYIEGGMECFDSTAS